MNNFSKVVLPLILGTAFASTVALADKDGRNNRGNYQPQQPPSVDQNTFQNNQQNNQQTTTVGQNVDVDLGVGINFNPDFRVNLKPVTNVNLKPTIEGDAPITLTANPTIINEGDQGDAPITLTANPTIINEGDQGDAPITVDDHSTSEFNSDGRSLYGTTNVSTSGNCGAGWGINLGLSEFTGTAGQIGFGNSSQDKTCLKLGAGTALLNTGSVQNDNAITAAGIGALAETFPEAVGSSLQQVSDNLSKGGTTCTVNSSPILLASKNGCFAPNMTPMQ